MKTIISALSILVLFCSCEKEQTYICSCKEESANLFGSGSTITTNTFSIYDTETRAVKKCMDKNDEPHKNLFDPKVTCQLK